MNLHRSPVVLVEGGSLYLIPTSEITSVFANTGATNMLAAATKEIKETTALGLLGMFTSPAFTEAPGVAAFRVAGTRNPVDGATRARTATIQLFMLACLFQLWDNSSSSCFADTPFLSTRHKLTYDFKVVRSTDLSAEQFFICCSLWVP